ncbi:hypothetical protein OF83DRAFT_1176597 [Amylostereum chailletii]|nr:hypothetical protein OF83DRAFT_1176597 [Amylostereum chailletii]
MLPSLGLEKTPSLLIAYAPLSSSAKSTPGKSTVSTAAFMSGTGTTVTPQGAATASSSAQDLPGSQGLLPHRLPLRPSPHRGGLFLDPTIASESFPRATTPDFPLGFTRGTNPGEYYALTLGGRRTVHWTHNDGVTAQWYFNDEEGFPYVEQTDIDVVAQEHDRIYNPQTPKREEVATAPQEEGSPPPPPQRDQPWSVPSGIRFDERTKKWYAYKKNGRAVKNHSS